MLADAINMSQFTAEAVQHNLIEMLECQFQITSLHLTVETYNPICNIF